MFLKNANQIVADFGNVLAIAPEQLQALDALYERREGAEQFAAARGGQADNQRQQGSALAVISLYGPMSQRGGYSFFGGNSVSTESFGATFRQAAEDPNISGILIDVHSGGGSVYGTQILSDLIYSYRGAKPINAIANSVAASAAYWVGSAADRLYVVPGGEVGSIGVIAIHFDESQAAAKAGVNVTVITAGKYKAEFSPFAPLGGAAYAELQSQVDSTYREFVRSVARNRGVSTGDVLAKYREGRMAHTGQALAAGMADGITTRDALIRSMLQGTANRNKMKATLAEGGGHNLTAQDKARMRLQLAEVEGTDVSPERQVAANKARLQLAEAKAN